jgi:hypothetical protein
LCHISSPFALVYFFEIGSSCHLCPVADLKPQSSCLQPTSQVAGITGGRCHAQTKVAFSSVKASDFKGCLLANLEG